MMVFPTQLFAALTGTTAVDEGAAGDALGGFAQLFDSLSPPPDETESPSEPQPNERAGNFLPTDRAPVLSVRAALDGEIVAADPAADDEPPATDSPGVLAVSAPVISPMTQSPLIPPPPVTVVSQEGFSSDRPASHSVALPRVERQTIPQSPSTGEIAPPSTDSKAAIDLAAVSTTTARTYATDLDGSLLQSSSTGEIALPPTDAKVAFDLAAVSTTTARPSAADLDGALNQVAITDAPAQAEISALLTAVTPQAAVEVAAVPVGQPPASATSTTDRPTRAPHFESPSAEKKAPVVAVADDDGKAPILALEVQAPTVTDPVANPTGATVVKNSHPERPLPVIERSAAIQEELNVVAPRDGKVVSQLSDSQPGRDGVRPVVGADGRASSYQPEQRDADANQPGQTPAWLGAAVPLASAESHGETSTAPAWRPLVEHLARDIGDHLRIGKQEALLQLDPPDLGKVKIDLRLEDGQLHVRIAAEDSHAQQLIEHHLAELHQALRAGDTNLADVRLTQGEWRSGGSTQQFDQAPQGRQDAPRGFGGRAQHDENQPERPRSAPPSADGRVSMWA